MTVLKVFEQCKWFQVFSFWMAIVGNGIQPFCEFLIYLFWQLPSNISRSETLAILVFVLMVLTRRVNFLNADPIYDTHKLVKWTRRDLLCRNVIRKQRMFALDKILATKGHLFKNSLVFPLKNPSWHCPSGAAVFLLFFRLSVMPSCFEPL